MRQNYFGRESNSDIASAVCVSRVRVSSSSMGKYYEPLYEKTNDLLVRVGLTEVVMYSHKRRLNAWNFGFIKKMDCTIRVAKTKALISYAITAQLDCTFVFAHADC